MALFYLNRSNQYARMSAEFYENYLRSKKTYDDLARSNAEKETSLEHIALSASYLAQMDDSAIATVVFQALSIEAYVNLMGKYFLSSSKFKEIESFPITEKLNFIAEKIKIKIPQSLIDEIAALFKKRNKFVHQKPKKYTFAPKPYNYKNPQDNFFDIEEIFREASASFQNIDNEVLLYDKLRETIKTLRQVDKELIEEIQSTSIFD